MRRSTWGNCNDSHVCKSQPQHSSHKQERLQLPRDWTGKSPCSLVPACTKKLQAVRTHIALGFPKIGAAGYVAMSGKPALLKHTGSHATAQAKPTVAQQKLMNDILCHVCSSSHCRPLYALYKHVSTREMGQAGCVIASQLNPQSCYHKQQATQNQHGACQTAACFYFTCKRCTRNAQWVCHAASCSVTQNFLLKFCKCPFCFAGLDIHQALLAA